MLVVLLRRKRPALPGWLKGVVERPIWCAAILFALPIALRLAVIARNPVPVPAGADDFGYLLVADTLRHLRLANPPNALPDFFEQIFVLQRPAYAAIFPLGSGILLAIGWTIFATPWAGVLLGAGLLPVAVYWMLRGWVEPSWAAVGGLLAGLQFGPLSYWMNCYWGGYVSAIAGCVAFGAVSRCNDSWRNDAVLGLGVALQALTRQYEFVLLLAALALIRPRRPHWITLVCFAPAALLIAAQNHAITGRWTTLPYAQYRYEYGVPATFAMQADPVPHHELNQEQDLDYRTEAAVHDAAPPFFSRLLFRFRFVRFFLFPPLMIAFVFGVRRNLRGVLTIAVFAFGSTFYPYFYPHYIAAICGVVLLIAVQGLRRLGSGATIAVVAVCTAQVAFGLAIPQGGWDWLNGPNPQGRATINARLAHEPGRQIVFVHYSPVHGFAEWIHNDADVPNSRIIWVHDLGRERNRELLEQFRGRKPWLLLPDETPPRLEPYPLQNSPFEDVP